MSSLLRHALSRFSKNKNLFIRLTLFVLLAVIIYFSYLLPNGYADKWSKHSTSAVHLIKSEYMKEFQKLNPVISGWGELGQPVYLNEHDQDVAKKQFSSAAFNVFISDRIRLLLHFARLV